MLSDGLNLQINCLYDQLRRDFPSLQRGKSIFLNIQHSAGAVPFPKRFFSCIDSKYIKINDEETLRFVNINMS